MDKEDIVYIYSGILLNHKKEGNNVIYSSMDATRDYHTKWNKSERDRYHMISHMQNLKYGTNEPIYKTETGSQTQRTDLWLIDGGDWEPGINRCKLVYIEWINNKDLLYSTENYMQYSVINHNGKEYEKEYIHITYI